MNIIPENQKKILTKLASVLVFFSPFSAWLALSPWLRLPITINLIFIVASLNILVYYFRYNIKKLLIDREDLLLIIFLILVWYSFFFGFFNQRSFNHSLSYTYSIFGLFFISKFIFEEIKLKTSVIAQIAMYSVVVCNLIVIIEWILFNLFDGIIIRDFFLTGGPGTSNMTIYYQTFFWSVGGVGEEPGGTASLVNILFTIGLIAFKNRSKLNLGLYVFLHFISMIFMASAAGMTFLIFSLVFSSFLKYKYVVIFIVSLLITSVIIVILYKLDLFESKVFFDKYLSYTEEKVSLDRRNASASERTIKWTHAIDDWRNSPFIGNGPGYGVEQYSSGYFNTILTLLADTGIFSTILFISFLLIIFRKIFSLQHFEKYCVLASFTMLLLHSSVYYVYYHFPFWLLIIVIQQLYREK